MDTWKIGYTINNGRMFIIVMSQYIDDEETEQTQSIVLSIN